MGREKRERENQAGIKNQGYIAYHYRITGFLARIMPVVSRSKRACGSQTKGMKEGDCMLIKHQFLVYKIVLYMYILTNKP